MKKIFLNLLRRVNKKEDNEPAKLLIAALYGSIELNGFFGTGKLTARIGMEIFKQWRETCRKTKLKSVTTVTPK